MFDVPPQISQTVTISTMSPDPHRLPPRVLPPPPLLPFDVGCSDVLMFDVPPQISHRSPSQRCRTTSRLPLRPPASAFLPFDVGCSDVPMFDVPPQIWHPATISTTYHRRSPSTASASSSLRCWMFRCSDVRCSAANLARATISTTPSPSFLASSRLAFPSLRCWMFRCSDVRCSAANLAPATISTIPASPPPAVLASPFLPFDVGCSDVPMFDVPPQIAHPATISTTSRSSPPPPTNHQPPTTNLIPPHDQLANDGVQVIGRLIVNCTPRREIGHSPSDVLEIAVVSVRVALEIDRRLGIGDPHDALRQFQNADTGGRCRCCRLAHRRGTCHQRDHRHDVGNVGEASLLPSVVVDHQRAAGQRRRRPAAAGPCRRPPSDADRPR